MHVATRLLTDLVRPAQQSDSVDLDQSVADPEPAVTPHGALAVHLTDKHALILFVERVTGQTVHAALDVHAELLGRLSGTASAPGAAADGGSVRP